MSRAEPDPLQQCDCGGDVAPSYGKSPVFNAGLCDEAVRSADEPAITTDIACAISFSVSHLDWLSRIRRHASDFNVNNGGSL